MYLYSSSFSRAQWAPLYNVVLLFHFPGIGPGGGGTLLYGLYRYVRAQRVWFFICFGHKQGIDFS